MKKILNLLEKTTNNNLIEKGLMEKIFGGVGKGYVPNAAH